MVAEPAEQVSGDVDGAPRCGGVAAGSGASGAGPTPPQDVPGGVGLDEVAVVGIVDRVDLTDTESEDLREAASALSRDNGRQ